MTMAETLSLGTCTGNARTLLNNYTEEMLMQW